MAPGFDAGHAQLVAALAGSDHTAAAIKAHETIGTDTEARDVEDRIPLMCALQDGSAAQVQRLLWLGPGPNLGYTEERYTALMLAAAEGRPANVLPLPEYKADVSQTSASGHSAQSLAPAHRRIAGD